MATTVSKDKLYCTGALTAGERSWISARFPYDFVIQLVGFEGSPRDMRIEEIYVNGRRVFHVRCGPTAAQWDVQGGDARLKGARIRARECVTVRVLAPAVLSPSAFACITFSGLRRGVSAGVDTAPTTKAPPA